MPATRLLSFAQILVLVTAVMVAAIPPLFKAKLPFERPSSSLRPDENHLIQQRIDEGLAHQKLLSTTHPLPLPGQHVPAFRHTPKTAEYFKSHLPQAPLRTPLELQAAQLAQNLQKQTVFTGHKAVPLPRPPPGTHLPNHQGHAMPRPLGHGQGASSTGPLLAPSALRAPPAAGWTPQLLPRPQDYEKFQHRH